MELDEYYRDLMNLVQTNAELDQDYLSNAFVAEVGQRLAEAEEVENLDVISFDGLGARNRRVAVNGFDLNDSDGSIALAVLDFVNTDRIRTLNTTDARKRLSALEAYLEDAASGSFLADREESTPEYELAQEIQHRGRAVTRYRLYLVTNAVLGDRVKAMPSTTINGVPVDFHLWDVQRLFDVTRSSQGREALEIDLTDWAPRGIPALEVADQDSEFRTYLAAVPAVVIAELYGRYGSRLLEGNVRSYLSNRGKVNKGIRTTILKDPAHFLAYNNGITATATAVKSDPETGAIVGLTDLQIVNGGQTTASLFYVSRDERPKPDLTNVYVQMKLVSVEPSVALEMVPQISRFANSQNRVSEADFFSNSPFHVRLEELSRRLLVPAQPGENYQTKWFYERTRGQYQNERNKLGSAAQRKFDAQFPKSQVINKTDAAKYEVSWLMQPHQVSGGAQRNFVAFAEAVAKRWATSDVQFNEVYFKTLVAKGILFNRLRSAISHADWYESGYLANIVTYTIAKLAYEISRQGGGDDFDFERVWTTQDISPVTAAEGVLVGEHVLDVLTARDRPVANVTEWAKRPACWELVKRVPFELSPQFLQELEGRAARAERVRAAQVTQKIDSGIAAQSRVVSTPAETWQDLRMFCLENRLASVADMSLLEIVSGSRRMSVPSEKQSARLLALLQKAEDHGYVS